VATWLERHARDEAPTSSVQKLLEVEVMHAQAKRHEEHQQHGQIGLESQSSVQKSILLNPLDRGLQLAIGL
jgi:hypothetical protein